MKLTINKYEGYANMPAFCIDYGAIVFEPPTVSERDHDTAWYLAYTYDKSVLSYRMLCREYAHGNSNYHCRPRGYKSGWSSRVSVVNKELDSNYVDVGSYAIELDKLLYLLEGKYVGDVYISKRDTHIHLEYIVAPYCRDMAYKYDTDRKHLIMHTAEPEFTEKALLFLTGSPDLFE